MVNTANFYEKLDDIFNSLVSKHPEYFNKDIMQVKSDVIQAYEYNNMHRGDYLEKLMKPKYFAITEDGKIVSL
jgi:hypothetical protein